ncbi:MAG: helix-turn-helix transcriptional regulator [Bacteroidota bacterium]
MGRTQRYMIENGKTNPRLLTLLKIAQGLEVSLETLFGFGD